jgi:hypothetical protein
MRGVIAGSTVFFRAGHDLENASNRFVGVLEGNRLSGWISHAGYEYLELSFGR